MGTKKTSKVSTYEMKIFIHFDDKLYFKLETSMRGIKAFRIFKLCFDSDMFCFRYVKEVDITIPYEKCLS